MLGPEDTVRPSRSVPWHASPDALSKNANANAMPRSRSMATKRQPGQAGSVTGRASLRNRMTPIASTDTVIQAAMVIRM